MINNTKPNKQKLKQERTSLSNVSKVNVKFKAMNMGIMPSLYVIAYILSEIMHVKKVVRFETHL